MSDVGKSTVEINTLVRMAFHDARSLDVLIHQAQELRKSMPGAKWTAEEHDKVMDGPTHAQ